MFRFTKTKTMIAAGWTAILISCLFVPETGAQGRDFDYLKGKVFDITLSVGEESPRLITIEKVKIKALVEIRRMTFLVGEKWYPGRGRPTTAMENEEILVPWERVLYFITSSREIGNSRLDESRGIPSREPARHRIEIIS